MPLTKSFERHFEQFRTSFYSKNVFVNEDCLVYRTPKGMSDKICRDANNLIGKLNLPLVAIGTTFQAKDSLVVKSNEIEL